MTESLAEHLLILESKSKTMAPPQVLSVAYREVRQHLRLAEELVSSSVLDVVLAIRCRDETTRATDTVSTIEKENVYKSDLRVA